MFRVLFTLAVTFALTFGIFSGTGVAYAAKSQPTAAAGYNPVDSVPSGVNFCYPSGYNRQGWRCGWRLAMYPYNMGACYYGPCGGYYYGYTGNPYYYGGREPGYVADYGGQPRYNPCYYNTNCYNPCYNPCYTYGTYCSCYR